MSHHSTLSPSHQTALPVTLRVPGALDGLIDHDRLAELRFALGTVRLSAMLELLVTECRDRPASLRRGHGRNDLAGIRAGAHSLRAAALNFGAVALSEAAGRLRAAPSLLIAAERIEALDDAARATLTAIEGLLDRSLRMHAVA